MADYSDGNWHLWDGGECPVHPKSIVEYIYHNEDLGIIKKEKLAAGGTKFIDPLDWQHIVKFRVLREHNEHSGPQEIWLRERTTLYGEPDGFHQCDPNDEDARLFREVMDEPQSDT